MSELDDLNKMVDRAGERAKVQLKALSEHLGRPSAEVLALAIERLYQVELGSTGIKRAPGQMGDLARKAKEMAAKAKKQAGGG